MNGPVPVGGDGGPSPHRVIQTWLCGTTLPFWFLRGIDSEAGGFHEKLDLRREPIVDQGKRTMVQARQIYTFARVAGDDDVAAEAAQAGFRFMVAHCRHPDGGWRHRVARDGAPLDDTRDLYDQAFAIFAAAWMLRTATLGAARDLADDTLAWLDHERAHPAGGYVERTDGEGAVVAGPRRQNPHMHLFEAVLALYEATWDDRYLERAERLYALARDRFVVDGTLREYLGDTLEPLAGEDGRIVEPGHHFEWAWLLHRYAVLSGGLDPSGLASVLYDFALAHGIDPRSGGVIDEVHADGAPRRSDRRLWPQTEALKAHAARFERFQDPVALERIDAAIGVLMRDHLVGDIGAWREHVHPGGENFYRFIPASSLYHLTFAVTELDRVLGDPE